MPEKKYRVKVRMFDTEPWGWFVHQYGERGHHHGTIEAEAVVYDSGHEAEFVADWMRLVMGRQAEVVEVE